MNSSRKLTDSFECHTRVSFLPHRQRRENPNVKLPKMGLCLVLSLLYSLLLIKKKSGMNRDNSLISASSLNIIWNTVLCLYYRHLNGLIQCVSYYNALREMQDLIHSCDILFIKSPMWLSIFLFIVKTKGGIFKVMLRYLFGLKVRRILNKCQSNDFFIFIWKFKEI